MDRCESCSDRFKCLTDDAIRIPCIILKDNEKEIVKCKTTFDAEGFPSLGKDTSMQELAYDFCEFLADHCPVSFFDSLYQYMGEYLDD